MPRRSESEYLGDLIDDVWRAGGNPDAVDRDRVAGYYAEHVEEEDAVIMELRAQRRYYEHEDA